MKKLVLSLLIWIHCAVLIWPQQAAADAQLIVIINEAIGQTTGQTGSTGGGSTGGGSTGGSTGGGSTGGGSSGGSTGGGSTGGGSTGGNTGGGSTGGGSTGGSTGGGSTGGGSTGDSTGGGGGPRYPYFCRVMPADVNTCAESSGRSQSRITAEISRQVSGLARSCCDAIAEVQAQFGSASCSVLNTETTTRLGCE